MGWETKNPEIDMRSKKNRPFRAYSRSSQGQCVGANLLPIRASFPSGKDLISTIKWGWLFTRPVTSDLSLYCSRKCNKSTKKSAGTG